MDLHKKIVQTYNTMTPSGKKISDYLLHNFEQSIALNTRTLSEAVGVSSASIVRFAHSLGYDTYAAMRMDIVRCQEMLSKPSAFLTDPGFSFDYAELQLSNNIISAIVETRKLQLRENLCEASRMIHNANMIYLFGVGTSGIAASAFHSKMIYINKSCTFYNNNVLSAISSSHSMHGDVALGISYSGYNKDVLFSMETCKKNKAFTIGITQMNSPLAKYLDILLPIPYVDDGLCSSANLSIYAQMMLLDMLYLELLQISREEVEKSLSLSHDTITRFDSMRKQTNETKNKE